MYPGEKQHVAYQEYVLDHAMGDGPSGPNGKTMTKKEWITYTKKGENKMAGTKPPPSKPVGNSMRNYQAN